jgi:hypothetical protein
MESVITLDFTARDPIVEVALPSKGIYAPHVQYVLDRPPGLYNYSLGVPVSARLQVAVPAS